MGKPGPYAESLPLEIEDLELDGPQEGEVLIEIKAAGLCHSDLSVINGSRPRVMPMVLGHEAAGIVREVGPGVRAFSPDDHVVLTFVPSCGECDFCVSGRPTLCKRGAVANVAGTLLTGRRPFRRSNGQELHQHLGVSGFSAYTVVSQQSLVKIDPAIPFAIASVFGCAVMTGAGAVFNTAKLRPGDSAAVFGIGGVGLSAIMAAKAAGAFPIIAVDRLPQKLEVALQAGATHTVNAASDDPVSAIRDITGGGVSAAFEAAGIAQTSEQAWESVATGGKLVCLGLPGPQVNLAVPIVRLVGEERTIHGSYMGSSTPRRDIPKFLAMHQAGVLNVDLLQTATIGIHEINGAFDKLAEGKEIRQIVSFE
jgi:alcohol dehydrogenase